MNKKLDDLINKGRKEHLFTAQKTIVNNIARTATNLSELCRMEISSNRAPMRKDTIDLIHDLKREINAQGEDLTLVVNEIERSK